MIFSSAICLFSFLNGRPRQVAAYFGGRLVFREVGLREEFALLVNATPAEIMRPPSGPLENSHNLLANPMPLLHYRGGETQSSIFIGLKRDVFSLLRAS
jgi:hypothetical protein